MPQFPFIHLYLPLYFKIQGCAKIKFEELPPLVNLK